LNDTSNSNNITQAMFPVEDEAFGASGALVQGDNCDSSTESCFLCFGVESIDKTMARALANVGSEMHAK
jgi:predicted enzyme related to lactoylglutathione lyase